MSDGKNQKEASLAINRKSGGIPMKTVKNVKGTTPLKGSKRPK